MKLYHGSSERRLETRTGVLDFCLTENFDVAAEYATDLGDDGYVHEFRFRGSIADEEQIREIAEANGYRLIRWSAVELLDTREFRAIVTAKFDAAEFADTTNGGQPITTVRVFSADNLSFITTHNVEF